MSVAELIEALKGLDPSLPVVIWTPHAAEGYGLRAKVAEAMAMASEEGEWREPFGGEDAQTVACIH